MKLYHGTSETRVKKILQEGIKPREISGKSNWKHTIESNPEAVYLTSAYPLYFANQASKKNERWVVVEIETDLLDQSKLHPDEDVLEQAGRKYDGLPKTWSMKRRTRYYRETAIYNPNWKLSLEGMGTCAYYGTIPVSAITRVAYFDSKKYDAGLVLSLIDATISLLGFRFCGEQYKARTKWLFGDCSDPKKVAGFGFNIPGEQGDATRKYWTEQVQNRSGIEIHNLLPGGRSVLDHPGQPESETVCGEVQECR